MYDTPNFEQFYGEFTQTNMYQYCMTNSTNTEAVSWITDAASIFMTDYTTLHDYWNAIIDELNPTVNSAIIQELDNIASNSFMQFTFVDSNAKIDYI